MERLLRLVKHIPTRGSVQALYQVARFVPPVFAPAWALARQPVTFIDTLAVFVRHVPPGIIKQLQAVNGPGDVCLKTIKGTMRGREVIHGWCIVIQCPTMRTIRQLAELPHYCQPTLSRVDIAYDFESPRTGDENTSRNG